MANRFKCTLAGGSAGGNTLVVTCDSQFAGKTISATKSSKTYTKQCPSVSPYTVEFSGLEAGTWTISGVIDGVTYETEAIIQDVSAVLVADFKWKDWVDLSVDLDSSDYATLDELLADEKAVRELMLVHDCVDFLAAITRAYISAAKIINNDICAKWINLCDYSLDTLYANTYLATMMDTADKYFYGEWSLLPQIPTMTSNTAPYGEVLYDSQSSGEYTGYKAFDNDGSTKWLSASDDTSGMWLGYHFVKPVTVCMIEYRQAAISADGLVDTTAKVQYSDDGTTWQDLETIQLHATDGYSLIQKTLSTPITTEYIRLKLTSNNRYYAPTGPSAGRCGCFATLQFYAWEAKGAVPIMTANNAPYGVASASSVYSTAGAAYAAFDASETSGWSSQSGSAVQTLTYEFTNPICLKKYRIVSQSNDYITGWKIRGSNDNSTWEDLDTETSSVKVVNDYDVTTDKYFKYLQLYVTASARGLSNSGVIVEKLQYYGRQLSVTVPYMTSATTPYGQVIASEPRTDTQNQQAWRCFDGNSSGSSAGSTRITSNGYFGYIFPEAVSVECFSVYGNPNSTYWDSSPKTIKLQSSNDGGETWIDNTEEITYGGNGASYIKLETHNATKNKGGRNTWRLLCIDNWGDSGHGEQPCILCNLIQFYGLDYSEKEYEAGSGKKWLYDHGVMLENIVAWESASVISEDSQMGYDKSSGVDGGLTLETALDLTPWDIVRLKAGNTITNPASEIALTGFTIYHIIATNELPNNCCLDISAADEAKKIIVCANAKASSGKFTMSELWLEPTA